MFAGFARLPLARPLIVLDVETTGINPRHDRLVEVAALRYAPLGPPCVFQQRLNPGMPIPAAATAVHGIRESDVAACPTFDRVAPRLLRFLADSDLAGYNVAFDLQFLTAELRRCGHDLPLAGRALLDPKVIFHRREPRDLTAAVTFYCGRMHDGAHAALADAAAAAEVLDAQLRRYGDLPRSVADLHQMFAPLDVSGKFRLDDGVILFAFGRWQGRPLDEVAHADPGYLEWMLDGDFLDDVKELVRRALDRVNSD